METIGQTLAKTQTTKKLLINSHVFDVMAQGGKPTVLKNSTKKGTRGNLNLAGKYYLCKVNRPRGGLHS